jgi:hypothetical protein
VAGVRQISSATPQKRELRLFSRKAAECAKVLIAARRARCQASGCLARRLAPSFTSPINRRTGRVTHDPVSGALVARPSFLSRSFANSAPRRETIPDSLGESDAFRFTPVHLYLLNIPEGQIMRLFSVFPKFVLHPSVAALRNGGLLSRLSTRNATRK